MSNSVFPSLPGRAWPINKSPMFNTLEHRSASGREIRGTYQLYPLYQFGLTYEVLRDTAAYQEIQSLVGFFLARQGKFDSFLFTDPSDNAVTAAQFGTGDGSTTAFQLTRSYGGFLEPVQNVNGAPSIYVNAVLKTAGTDYTLSATGLVTFTSAPAAAAALTWTGSYYYRCRFLDDQIDPSMFMSGLWELKKLDFIGAPGNRV